MGPMTANNDGEGNVVDEAVRAYEDEWIRQCRDRITVDKRLCVSAVLAVCFGRIVAASGELGKACEDTSLTNYSDIIRCAIKGFAALNNIEPRA
jgi:hypothetical protein